MEEEDNDIEEPEQPKRPPPETQPPPKRKTTPKIKIPRREPSVVIPPRQVLYRTADKITCVECGCFPKMDPWRRKQKLTGEHCQKTPPTLYELASAVVDHLKFPPAFQWGEEEVADWMEHDVGYPEYRACILDNHINGKRLLMLEYISRMPMINIRNFEHITWISKKIHALFSTEWVKFSRSIGLPPRKPLTHCTWFKSRTGPIWGIRENWTRSDLLRWMKIIMPAPVYRDHWDLVWYRKPDFPKVLFARIPGHESEPLPKYTPPPKEPCREYLAKRKFKILKNVETKDQYIWMEHRPGSPIESEWKLRQKYLEEERERKRRRPPTIPKKSRLDVPEVILEGLTGDDLILARRRLPRTKFFPKMKYIKSIL